MDNQEIDYLFEAVKREIHFQATENDIKLDEEDMYDIANTMVFNRDWSRFNDWIMEEIQLHLDRKEKE
jgi:deoxyhypusine synthase